MPGIPKDVNVREREITDDVLAAARAGDERALTAIYTAFAPALAGYLRAKGVADPEATTSDVFLAVLPRIGNVTGGVSGLRTLLFSVAHARMVDEHRARARHPAAISYDPLQDDRVAVSAEEAAQVELGTQRVHDILAVLPPDQRDVLALRFVADLSVEQVATVIGRSPGAVKQLQRRGLIAIRAALTGTEVTR